MKYVVIFAARVEVEADSEEEARKIASGQVGASLCNQCSKEVNVGDTVTVKILEK